MALGSFPDSTALGNPGSKPSMVPGSHKRTGTAPGSSQRSRVPGRRLGKRKGNRSIASSRGSCMERPGTVPGSRSIVGHTWRRRGSICCSSCCLSIGMVMVGCIGREMGTPLRFRIQPPGPRLKRK